MPMLGNNLGANGSKLKWYSIKMLNRIPQVELERKLNDIGRLYAAIKREARIEEGQLWDFLFSNYQLLETSIARFPEGDIVAGSVDIVKPRGEKEDPPPYSEVYRQFIIYKAHASAQMFGPDKVPRRPKYKDLYRRMKAPKLNNSRNVTALLAKFNAQYEQNERILAALKAPGIEITDFDDLDGSQSRRQSIRNSRRKMTNGDIMASLTQQENIMTSKPAHEEDVVVDRKEERSKSPEDVMTHRDSTEGGNHEQDAIQASKVAVPSKPLLPPLFLTVPARPKESEARPPIADQEPRNEKRRKSSHRLKLPKVDE